MASNEGIRCSIRGHVTGDCFSGYLVKMKDAATSPIDWSDDELIESKSKAEDNLKPQPDGKANGCLGSVELVEVRETLHKLLSENKKILDKLPPFPGNENTSNAPSEPYPEVPAVAEPLESPKRKRSESQKVYGAKESKKEPKGVT
uniref:Uncharacterized protein n=1 Tax=Phlebotomus papatasi TaxID=29031 RepID=A0A1B0DG33_PHLPP